MRKFDSLKCVLCNALFVFLLMSCRDESVKPIEIDVSTSSTQHTESAYLRLRLNAPNDAILRNGSVVSDPMQKVTKVLLLFYGQNDNTLKTIKEIKDVASQDQLTNIVVKVEPNDYKLVVVANPSERVRTLINPNAPLSNIEQGQFILSRDLFNDTNKSIVMTNDQGPVSIRRTEFHANTSDISKTHTITLEPTLARVFVYGTPELRAGTKGKAPVKFVVNNLPKQVSLLRQLNLLSTGVQEVSGDQSSRQTRYAKSPFWEAWTNTTPHSVEDIASYTTAQLCANEMENLVQENLSASQGLLENKSLYLKESTMPSTCFLKSFVPYAHIAYPYIPKGLKLGESEGWLSYQGVYYSESDAKEALKQKVSSNKLYQVLQERHVTLESFDNPEGFSINGLNFYYKGYSYYAVFIKHFGRERETYGRYGIVRGNEYRIRLLSINDPGSPIPIRYNDEFTSISEQENARVGISVQAVETREQAEDI